MSLLWLSCYNWATEEFSVSLPISKSAREQSCIYNMGELGRILLFRKQLPFYYFLLLLQSICFSVLCTVKVNSSPVSAFFFLKKCINTFWRITSTIMKLLGQTLWPTQRAHPAEVPWATTVKAFLAMMSSSSPRGLSDPLSASASLA